MALDSSEPEPKRVKITNVMEELIDKYLATMQASQTNLKPVVNDDMYKQIPLIKTAVGIIKNQKDISKTIITLNEKIPMKELQHLKRVQNKEVVICPVDYLNGSKIEDFIQEKAEDLKEVFEEFREVYVPSLAPKVRSQFDECNKVWPCNFHPNKYNEQLVSGNFFSVEELADHRQFMTMVFEVIRFYLKDISVMNIDPDKVLKNLNSSIVVDPATQSVVAVSFDNRLKHPLQHSAMLAIDNVAKTQNGGAWVANKAEMETIDITLRGIDEELLCHLQEKFPEVKFGAKKFKSKRDMTEKEKGSSDIGPYLCTGYNVYLLREPCLMCSMALVHARAKRVFFSFDNTESGALQSKVKLQTVSSLNHHFEVFTGFF